MVDYIRGGVILHRRLEEVKKRCKEGEGESQA